MKQDKPLALPIKKIIIESERVKTFVFDYDFPGEPGQFVMCWIPGFDEKPFGIIKKEGTGFMISVAKVGASTEALHMMEVGDMLGFRGPYGSTFTLPEEGSIALIAGGYGMVPLSYLAQEARKKDIDVHLFIGARNKEELLFKSWMEEIGVVVHASTDDGSEGYKGFNTDLFKNEVENRKSNDQSPMTKVYTVGPQIMELKIAQICWEHSIPFEVSLERYMKCGFGICGQCSVDPTGWRMCVEGPVIDGEKLKEITEFGKYHRTASGKVEKYPWAK
ncbi:dihydroorotate dehydrogenase electron transfer subunit [Candidatus Woesebacteria bacterium]|nr:dihydroorotate dehydrogenase electron transfer subunit [Candidatus Woesebacteria bacterium]